MSDAAGNGHAPGPTGPLGRALRAADPVGLGTSLAQALARVAVRPLATVGPTARFMTGVMKASAATSGRMVGIHTDGPISPAPGDNRFSDEAWSHNAWFYGLLQLYLLNTRLVNDIVAAADLSEPEGSKARFAAQLLMDAGAPTNYLFTNPRALRRAFDTGGRSLAQGWSRFLHDVVTNDGWPSQVNRDHFVLGKDLAASKGSVVYRNELIEVMQYAPVTGTVAAVPVLFCPPWINKYYIMDLSPGKSLVEWAVKHGYTVFAISYRNPDESMRELTFDDYMFRGPLAAIDVVRSVTGAAQVNTVAICLGGTLNAATVAYLEAHGDYPVRSSTYLNTMVDFSDAGPLRDVFTDEKTVQELTRRMERRGYLESAEMSHTFDLLRANDLVFRYVASSWLMGDPPPDFDLLAWNNDGTRMPARMHAQYLRTCYLENALARDEMEIGGTKLAVSHITNDSYLVAAVNDHIVPWRANYKATQLFKGPRRFVLTSGGHIAGIVNPPSPKAKLWVNEDLPAEADQWRAGAREVADTWWHDWLAWLAPRSGEQVPPPPMGNEAYPVLCEAPGTYARG